ncbi:substrate-binding domain-containing protein [Tamlana agarivorans]|uniref:Substrate-binding domain-containing protein n=1 Tax=Pseudotamlana agarivorans TaxID=481183 RepID=A0ACC5U9J9_9FLAO|nr:substrate-binding domain-containing protein [Tamlana agarivorans]MBU2950960.1 substrate-binding domain-containing protein [Tamlana agarivorans]
MIRIKDIAKEANVSEGTVDRVLHNRGGVSAKTEAKIRKILERSNYSINPVASALALKNKHHIAVLIPEHNDTDSFWKSPYLGILKASEDVKSYGVQVDYFSFNQYDPSSYLAAFKTALETQPKGVIFAPMFLTETKKITKQLEQLDIPYLFLNIDVEGFDNLTYIGQDSYTSGYIAAKLMHLELEQDAKLLIIKSRDHYGDNNAISKRIEGFMDYIKALTKTETVTLKVEDLNDTSKIQQNIKTCLNKQRTISGIFIPSSRAAVIVDGLKQNGYNDFKIIGFDNTPQNVARLKDDSISFLISQKPFEQGYESVRVMTDYLLKSKRPSEKTYLPIDILIKENVDFNDMNQLMFENDISEV